ncbi:MULTISPECIES: SusD/RagB family nutrient-binding outer membrane lipoprotein [Flavobacteriaceae]|uniref:SusD/RagB family nutrient-binding outer membrane lipoprotein n=2 Tax=Flavobacteriaceae TaxID=49546 RepID=A0A4Y8AS60_9FLAO|nr:MULTISPECIES: SusD/RagB family nutrient-binding outer membrane lipoprotein [Flavobacteriaceae]TEW73070.1 SusD/RagB family nutrient-binding outer membrane lipoprotein [Gramella jeungdoensis]GGK47246.1 hypothetical protein GCM10007963_14450 [Lutibacter litoralis]
MKKNIIYKASLLLSVILLTFSCDDFEEINVNPTAASADQVQVEYFINNSIIGTQMNPHVAERAFVLYWKAAGRMDAINSLPAGYADDGWSGDYYGSISGWLNAINTAIEIGESQVAAGTVKEYTNNMLQSARIWRAYLISEMADSFGPTPILAFQGVNPEFSSVEDVYYYMLEELSDAVNQLDPSINVPSSVSNLDASYGFDFAKWEKYGNSMRMRLAMRLSEVDPAKAKTEFEAAVAGSNFITTLDETFQVQELGGWNDLTGVMSREWNSQYLNATLSNLFVGLGSVKSVDQLSDYLHGAVKPADYMGVKYEDHFTLMSNDPNKGFWLDGLPEEIDPRAYAAFPIPGDFDNPEFCFYPSWASNARDIDRDLLNADGSTFKTIDATYTWNAPNHGSWGEKGSRNQIYKHQGTTPRLRLSMRNSTSKRVFFAPWESYFLVAEAAVRGWNVPMGGKQAYEAGISASFDYWEVSDYLGTYLASQDYNRVGTSVSWDHTIEPTSKTMNYVDGYTDATGTVEYTYPKNDLYMNGTVNNDLLTKIITQKFIAQNPWLPLETWNDHRRLGLPFFENPAIENLIPDVPALNTGNFMTSNVKFFPQRLKFPSRIANSDPAGYQEAVNLLGGEDNLFTPLWWAKQQ